MKKFILIVLAITMILSVTSCNSNSENKEPSNQELFDGGLEYLGRSQDCHYYRDVVTDVMYLYYNTLKAGGITEMSDPETGLPLTYTRYLELQNNGENNK